ncbi:MAG: pirin family protein [Planctomycetota bacterium]|jgi:redox-sensitive bicupin YhaK (pirin superfamily)
MITPRPADDRGLVALDWLTSHHSFSFGEYRDPAHMGFRTLRVINEDHVHPGRGFDTHGHRDMEILTWVLSGQLEHKDSMGNGSVIRPGELQRMSAGTGVLHSEHNPSADAPVHLLQIWILPDERGHEPGYAQTRFPETGRDGQWQLIASPDGADGSLSLHQDARVHAVRLAPGRSVQHALGSGRGAWVQVTHGALVLEAAPQGSADEDAGRPQRLAPGDGAAVEHAPGITLTAVTDAQALLFDLA